ncbi:hypothetical protein [Streptomyces sp. NBC_00893]|uniref:hypothetical protein n=1 Tax=Streptomyces sp. NBC_00893 TaxID=2975862 RepID=UPI00225297AD|nr:hypothetical protein [Streptomyces sp. NBC_00893]MCX4847777.1 hypothetical protein [Streptomyces sp. NBC_00893]
MTRTAHHVPPSRATITYVDDSNAPWHSVTLIGLRYSTRSLAEATVQARRPRPQTVRRRVDVYRFPRHNRDRNISRASTLEERRTRQRLRTQTGVLRRLLNTPASALTLEAADAIDIPPPKHRHGSLWQA